MANRPRTRTTMTPGMVARPRLETEAEPDEVIDGLIERLRGFGAGDLQVEMTAKELQHLCAAAKVRLEQSSAV